MPTGRAELEVWAELGAEAKRRKRPPERLGLRLFNVVGEIIESFAAPTACARTSRQCDSGTNHSVLRVVFDEVCVNHRVWMDVAQPNETPFDLEVIGAVHFGEVSTRIECSGLGHGANSFAIRTFVLVAVYRSLASKSRCASLMLR